MPGNYIKAIKTCSENKVYYAIIAVGNAMEKMGRQQVFSLCILCSYPMWQMTYYFMLCVDAFELHVVTCPFEKVSLRERCKLMYSSKRLLMLDVTTQGWSIDFPKGATWETGTVVEGSTNKLNSILLSINFITLKACWYGPPQQSQFPSEPLGKINCPPLL